MSKTIDALDIEATLDAMAAQLKPLVESAAQAPVMVGIHTGGLWIAEALHARLQLSSRLGSLNIHFYRDDFTRIGLHPQVKPSDLEENIDDRPVILVDDILHTGRTVRAALNELFDYGRPTSVTLVVLIDRGGHELPIAADVIGQQVTLPRSQHIKLHGPAPLFLKLTTGSTSR